MSNSNSESPEFNVRNLNQHTTSSQQDRYRTRIQSSSNLDQAGMSLLNSNLNSHGRCSFSMNFTDGQISGPKTCPFWTPGPLQKKKLVCFYWIFLLQIDKKLFASFL